MLFKKQGFPENSDIVICIVTKILPHAVFCNLNEYDKNGMIHISEISPGRIRNIREFVEEGKILVCKVLDVNQEKGYIDLSLRRVAEVQRRNKIDEMKQEQKAEKILEFVALKCKMDFKKLYDDFSPKIFKKYDTLNACFEEIVIKKVSLAKLGVDEKLAEEIEDVIRQRIKPPEVEIKATVALSSYDPEGIEIVKDTLKKMADAGKKSAEITYLGGGKFKVQIKAPDYKKAEKIFKEISDAGSSFMLSKKSVFKIERED